MDPGELQRRILAAFQTESEEQLRVLQQLIADWPASVGSLLDEAFRMAHSMKGGSRVCGLTELENDAHELESLLAKLANGQIQANEETLQSITRWVDQLEEQIQTVFAQSEATPPIVSPAKTPPSSTLAHQSTEISEEPSAAFPAPSPKTHVASSVSSDVLRVGIQHFEKLLKSSNQLLFEMVHLEGISDQLKDITAELEEWRKDQAAMQLQQRSEDSQRMARLGLKLLRVSEKHQSRVRNLKMLADKQQNEIRQIGMVPIQSILEGFPRMVRTLSEEVGKLVSFKMFGVDQRADRNVLQSLKDPIMHAIRNSISHGIETPETRHQRGKDPTGVIELHAEILGNTLVITLLDDGAGINYAKLREKVAEHTHLSTEQIEALSEEELTEFLFQPRFSTTDHVTQVSGRGVGLSVVHERAKHFQGFATIKDRTTQGTELRIEVPVAIAAHPLIIVKAGEQSYAIPQSSIHKLERCRELHLLEGKTSIVVDQQPYTLVTMAEAAGIEAGIMRNEMGMFEVALLKGDPKYALHFESIVGERHALIQALPYPASSSPFYSGGIFLENGEIALVLSINALLQRFHGSSLQELKSKSTSPKKPTILLADDSFTARTLQKSILETAGYQVHIAVDGKSAFDQIRVRSFDLVVSDVQMPNMNGFELLEAIKKEKNLAHIPVVLVTSLSSAQDQERGFSLGADAYIIKERFDHRELLDTIEQLI